MILGCHTKYTDKQLLGCTHQAIKYGANTFMFYTGAPQNSIRRSINMDYLNKAWELMKENNIDINNVVCHAPYIVNLANPKVNEFGISFLKDEITRCEVLNVKKLIIHPGSATGVSRSDGIDNIIKSLNKIISKEQNVIILLETMAGKGNECGSSLDEIKTIINGVEHKEKIGVCLDTCHLHDGGYNMANFDEFLDLFDNLIGIDKIGCIHLNDSKNEFNSHKDRHQNIGYGNIGFDNLLNITYNERIKNVPKILETPWYEDNPPYKQEIEMIKNKKFNENLYNDIIENS